MILSSDSIISLGLDKVVPEIAQLNDSLREQIVQLNDSLRERVGWGGHIPAHAKLSVSGARLG